MWDPLGSGCASTWRTRLIKFAAEVVTRTRRVIIRLSGTWPHLQTFPDVCRAILGRKSALRGAGSLISNHWTTGTQHQQTHLRVRRHGALRRANSHFDARVRSSGEVVADCESFGLEAFSDGLCVSLQSPSFYCDSTSNCLCTGMKSHTIAAMKLSCQNVVFICMSSACHTIGLCKERKILRVATNLDVHRIGMLAVIVPPDY